MEADTGDVTVLSYQPQKSNEENTPSFVNPVVSQSTGEMYAPKWLNQKSGAQFGFGGMLVTF